MRSARRATALLLLLLAVPVRAAPAALRGDDHLGPHLAVTGAGAALWVGTELAKSKLAPSSCRVCGTNRLDDWARNTLVLGGYVDEGRTASDVLALGVLPASYGAYHLLAGRAAGGGWETGARDLLYVAEAAVIAGSLNQVVKFAVGRQRPFVRYGNTREPVRSPDPDDDLSFYSGHSSLAFSLAAAAGTVADLRGYPSAPWVWAVGMTLASSVAYLRIAGDKHYLTDVLTGAAVGTAIGIAAPRLLHGRAEGTRGGGGGVSIVPVPLGLVGVF
jgi:membrane-associated phospholipid phosphatase